MPARASVCVCRALAVIAAGRTIRVLSVVDTYTRECLCSGGGHWLCQPPRDTRARGTNRAARHTGGDPLRQRPELTSRHFLAWAVEWKIDLRHIQPGKPIQNAHVESFH